MTCLSLRCGPAAWPLQVSWPLSLCQRGARSLDYDGRHTARPADSRFLPGQAVSGTVDKFFVAVRLMPSQWSAARVPIHRTPFAEANFLTRASIEPTTHTCPPTGTN